MLATLTLRELRGFASLVKAGLLALDDAGVAREEAFLLQDAAKLRIGLDECAGDAVARRLGLAGRAAAVHPDAQVVRPLEPGCLERREHLHAIREAREVVVERPAVEPRRAVAGAQDHARDRGLALAGAAVLRELAHLTSKGVGPCASCGCSGPA